MLLGGTLTESLRTPAWWCVALIQCAAIVLRRAIPLGALGVAWIGAAVQLAFLQEVGPQNLAILVVLYSTAAYGSRVGQVFGALSALGGGVLAGWYVASVLPAAQDRAAGSATFLVSLCVAIFVLAWLLGLLRSVNQRAQRERVAARVAAEQARHTIAVEEERARIARDMHDVVAHSLTVMIAQAEGARLVAETRGAASIDALATIADTGRDALTDVRGMLAELRRGERDSPQPSLDRLGVLVAQLRESGVAIEVDTVGVATRLRPQVDMAAFRVVQEALTNAVRHGDRSQPIHVSLTWLPTALQLEVRNAGATSPEVPHAGHGLIGMRERVHYVGGSLSAGASNGHFVVRAELPYSEEDTA